MEHSHQSVLLPIDSPWRGLTTTRSGVRALLIGVREVWPDQFYRVRTVEEMVQLVGSNIRPKRDKRTIVRRTCRKCKQPVKVGDFCGFHARSSGQQMIECRWCGLTWHRRSGRECYCSDDCRISARRDRQRMIRDAKKLSRSIRQGSPPF